MFLFAKVLIKKTLDLSFCQTELSHKPPFRRRRTAGGGSSMLPAALSRVHAKELEHKPSRNALTVEEAAVPEGDTSSQIAETLLD